MSTLSTVNPQIMDAVASGGLMVNGNASAQAIALLYQSMAHSAGLAALNAVTMQQQSNLIHQATTTMGVNLIYALGGASAGRAARKIRG
jgi:hypothetical protein